jgi:hypothetical protein
LRWRADSPQLLMEFLLFLLKPFRFTGQMSSKNRVSDSQVASFAAPFGIPTRKGIVPEGGSEGQMRRL